ncbi:MAG: peptidoglycan DD-metalloendopeptidase family protein [Candidatus Accumulibacter sp.]|jgi:lipoprotein NlpD|nr:peptidoglycan DD-metalloendopeptidase family protein [Accumulibacter sp.]
MKKNDFFSGIGYLAPVILALGLSACTSNIPAPVVGPAWSSGAPVQTAQPDTHIVKAGDTFYSIAREYNMDPRELIAINVNDVQNPDQLSVGRVLRLKPGVAIVAPVPSDVIEVRPIGDAPPVGGKPPESAGNTNKFKREPKAGKEPYSEQALAAARADEQARVDGPKPEPDENATGKPPAVTVANAKFAWIWPASGKIVGTFSENGSKGIDIAGKAGDPVVAAGSGKVVYNGTGLRGYGKLVIIKHDATFLSAYAHNQNILVKEGESVVQGQKIAEMGNTDADQVKLHFEVRRQGKPVDPLKYLPPR